MDLEQQATEIAVSEHAQKLGVLATQLGYQGSLTVGAVEDEIRFYQQRSVEAVMELGKRLLILKEMTPHGEFSKRIEMLGISKRTAQRFMSVVLKFSKTTSMSLLEKSGNGTKLLELMVLDDDDIEIIDAGGSIGDVSLDAIETMSVRELKKALREAKADNAAKDQLIQKKDSKINELDANLSKANSPVEIQKRAESEDQELEKAALETISTESLMLLNAVMRYQNAINGVLDLANEKGIHQLFDRIDESVVASYQRIAQFSQNLGIQIDFENMVTPEWLFPQAEAASKAPNAEEE
ncbi:DUF3102 domain-containing protein [Acinetobacter sp.]|uniref:DUF3102 domain-containing protein n=1 Tax=Acinetobacter sp. TaxID=472 RepID=UPI0028ACE001|nr:DUF3102 domain-containing protein [Acinetobacter sp.]